MTEPVFDECPCPIVASMYWHDLNDGWVEVYSFTPDLDVEAAAEAYRDSGASAFRVACPSCGRVYLTGIS